MSADTTDTTTAEHDWHQHLDSCSRCATQCFNLCPVGLVLFQRAGQEALGLPFVVEGR